MGLSQTELGKLIGKSQDTISKYEAGSREMGISELIHVAHVLRTSPAVLLGQTAVSEELETANKIVVASLKIAAKTTILRYAELQAPLVKKISLHINEFPFNQYIKETEDFLYEIRDQLLKDIRQYDYILHELYLQFLRLDPSGNAFLREFDITKLLAKDTKWFLDEANEEAVDTDEDI